jgi:hypothetical protein
MTEVGGRWAEVGERIEALALKVRLHFQQAGNPEASAEPLKKIQESVTAAFEAAGNAVRDDAVKADVRETGRLFLDAMSASFAKAAESLRKQDEPPPPAPTSPIESKPADHE